MDPSSPAPPETAQDTRGGLAEALQIYFPSSSLIALPGELYGERIDADTIYVYNVAEGACPVNSFQSMDWLGTWRSDEVDTTSSKSRDQSQPLLVLGICRGVALPQVLPGGSICENRSSIHILIYSPPALGYTYSTRRLDLDKLLYNATEDAATSGGDSVETAKPSRGLASRIRKTKQTPKARAALSPIPEDPPVTQLSNAIEWINRCSVNPERRDMSGSLPLSLPDRICGLWCIAFSLISCGILGTDAVVPENRGGAQRKKQAKKAYRWYEYSFFYTQMRYRLRQGLQMPALWRGWRDRRPVGDQDSGSVQRLRLFHTASIVGLDIAVGLTLAAFIWSTPSYFLLPLRRAYFYLNEHFLQSLVEWLMGSPAGFQMNKNLAKFVGTISLTVINYWNLLIKYCFAYDDTSACQTACTADEARANLSGGGGGGGVAYNFEVVVPLILACLGACGASVLLAFIIDLLSVVFFHIFFVYVGVTRLWSTNTSNLYTLFLLFRGKKYNILRERVDAHPFDLEQLLLGAVFLALFVFLLPTVFVFYVCFMLLWLSVLLSQLALWAIVTFFNQFPLYPLALSVTDTYSLPSGVTIKLMPVQNTGSRGNSGEVCYFDLSSHPLPSSEVLRAFFKEMIHQLPEESSRWLASVIWGSSLLTMKHRTPGLPDVYRFPEPSSPSKTEPETRRKRDPRDKIDGTEASRAANIREETRKQFREDVAFMARDLFPRD
ncbi:hypothetical protein FOL47_000077 [Perkinsus chesapeaki]|uniref:Phosphatidylinositol N-acetylglucosaminyltransferase subunit Q n=1 Tax=Perkinsus chesapeaki TaxID=330153 RepID=A0A7J6N349_PERCH|nr:hypothetical protein FOL47_000077 [Perkinsus chesapeaki]